MEHTSFLYTIGEMIGSLLFFASIIIISGIYDAIKSAWKGTK